jgi:hypothetical protein
MIGADFPEAFSGVRLSSTDEVAAIFDHFRFEHVFKTDRLLHLISPRLQLHIEYHLDESPRSPCRISLQHFKSKLEFQRLIQELKTSLIDIGFGHAFRPWPQEPLPQS